MYYESASDGCRAQNAHCLELSILGRCRVRKVSWPEASESRAPSFLRRRKQQQQQQQQQLPLLLLQLPQLPQTMSATTPTRTKITHLLQRRSLPQLSRPAFPFAFPTTCPARSRQPTRKNFASAVDRADSAEPVFPDSVNCERLSALLRSLIEQKQWTLDEDRAGVAKTYYFKTYTKCLDFTQVIGIRSKSKNHHSTITLKSGSVRVHWTTHYPRGLTDKDIEMARYCDQQAETIGTVEQSGANKSHEYARPKTEVLSVSEHMGWQADSGTARSGGQQTSSLRRTTEWLYLTRLFPLCKPYSDLFTAIEVKTSTIINHVSSGEL
ncbi:hypothetical protein UA08_02047 [Talaromyces atroroseus]|uniref:4a-hydroxytetrahydrobiopterin dehydratase n=1 Tax=Talaromyces atroroseus TaxID=1441469 RepID=A0A1Q5QAW3_TALAT|nr:hypothetical protein UA08_02047 [Talaromyces atroroseus]OKL63021.1 hypothetical protein UA08_02047 [Talaromyces atroroseus]